MGYIALGLIVLDFILSKELKNSSNNQVKKYCKRLLPTSIFINVCGKILKNLAELFSSILFGVWEILSNVFDLVILLVGWPFMVYKTTKVLKDFKLKNKSLPDDGANNASN